MKRASLVVVVVLLAVPAAHASDLDDAKTHYERGLSAYALGHYVEAADEYEKAFALRADPALLYNAAQAHRLAGNKTRALLLYQNYLKLFGKVPNRDEVQRHIAALKEAIASEHSAATAPPTEPAPVGHPVAPPSGEPSTSATTTAPAPAAGPAPAAAASTAPSGATESLTAAPPRRERKPKAWVIGVSVAAAAIAIGLAVGLGVGLSAGPSDPSPTLGAARLH